MNLRNISEAFIHFTVTYLVPVLSLFDPRPRRPTPPSDEVVDLEAPAFAPAHPDRVDGQALGEPALDPEAQAQPPGLVAHEHRKKDWNNAMVAFCLASSMAIALQPVQDHSQLQSSLPLLAIPLLLGFTSFFLSVFIDSKFVVTVRVLQKFGQFFTVTVFFMAVTVRFPFYFKCTSWAVYFISFLAVFISSCF